MKKLLSVLLAVIFAACSLSLVSAEPKATDPTREPGVGMNVSNFNTVDLDGNTVTGDILQNADLTFINYWATWCGPCKALSPILEELAEEYKDRIYIYKIDVDKEEKLSEIFGIRTVPTLLFSPLKGDPYMTSGVIPKHELKKKIEEILLK